MFAAMIPAIYVRPISITTHFLNPPKPYCYEVHHHKPSFLLSGVVKFPIRNIVFEPYGIRVSNTHGVAAGAFVNEPASVADDGFEAILNNLSKWLVTAVFMVIVLIRHDAEALWAAMGSVVNSAISKILKKILNQNRPVAHLRSDPGMPSSHAQSIFYFVVFSISSIIQWLGLNGFSAAMSGLIVAFGSYFTWLRVSQQLHTLSQVVVGALVGIIFSVLWVWSWHSIVYKAFLSHLSIRILVILGAAGFCVAFALHVIRYWFKDEVTLHISRKLPS